MELEERTSDTHALSNSCSLLKKVKDYYVPMERGPDVYDVCALMLLEEKVIHYRAYTRSDRRRDCRSDRRRDDRV